MKTELEQSIIKTLCYADIFDYPLTLEEITTWLIEDKANEEKVKTAVSRLKIIEEQDGYYFFKGKDHLVRKRRERKVYAYEKMQVAKKAAQILRQIPTIKLIGISGSLAWENTIKNDDIDFYIISKDRWLWTTRLLATMILDITFMRRHPSGKNVNNKICLNMFVDEAHLGIPTKDQNLFTAHEVARMKVLWEKDDVYRKFLQKNYWTTKYLPNIHDLEYEREFHNPYEEKIAPHNIEETLKKLQLSYMKRRRTIEVVTEGIIQFHPHNVKEKILQAYKLKVESYI